MLGNHIAYYDIGGKYFNHRGRLLTIRRAVYQIERLGYKVTFETAPNCIFVAMTPTQNRLPVTSVLDEYKGSPEGASPLAGVRGCPPEIHPRAGGWKKVKIDSLHSR